MGDLIAPLLVKPQITCRELLILLTVTLVAALMLIDDALSVADGLALSAAFLGYCYQALKSSFAKKAE